MYENVKTNKRNTGKELIYMSSHFICDQCSVEVNKLSTWLSYNVTGDEICDAI